MSKLVIFILGVFGVAFLCGCNTEINVNGNNNSIDTSPAKYAGYGGTVDVLKGMSLPSLSLGQSAEKESEEVKKDATKTTVPAETTVEKTQPAVVEVDGVKVDEKSVTVKSTEK